MLRWILLVSISIFVGNGCDTDNSVAEDPTAALQINNSQAIFSDAIGDFSVNVMYEVGAIPYTGLIGLTTNETWDITKSSYEALFQNHVGRTVSVPTAIGQMTQFADQAKSSWTSGDLIQLGMQKSPKLVTNFDVRVTVIFLNGMYNNDPNILGVHFAGYPFAFVFKDIVLSTGGDPVSQRYAEQATVVHELGHIVGLVNNGVPMAVAHEDGGHPKHSTNAQCVMYWQVESQSNILTSIAAAIVGNQLNLFGAQSLQDGRSFHP